RAVALAAGPAPAARPYPRTRTRDTGGVRPRVRDVAPLAGLPRRAQGHRGHRRRYDGDRALLGRRDRSLPLDRRGTDPVLSPRTRGLRPAAGRGEPLVAPQRPGDRRPADRCDRRGADRRGPGPAVRLTAPLG